MAVIKRVAGAKKTAKSKSATRSGKEPIPVEEARVEIIRHIKAKNNSADRFEPEIEDKDIDLDDPTSQRDKTLNVEAISLILTKVMGSKPYTERGYRNTLRSLEDFIRSVAGEAPSNATLGNILSGKIAQPPRSEQLKEIASVIPNPQEFKFESLKKEGLLKLAQAFGALFPDKNKKTEVDPEKLWNQLTEAFEDVLDALIPEEGKSINPKNLWAIFAGIDGVDEEWLESDYFEEAMEAIASQIENKEDRLQKEAEARRLKEEKINREKRLKKLADLIRLDMKIRGCDEEEYGKDIVRLNQKVLTSFLDGSVEDDEVFNFRLSKFAGLLTNPETRQGFYSADELWQYCDR